MNFTLLRTSTIHYSCTQQARTRLLALIVKLGFDDKKIAKAETYPLA
jgi:hypothetical protein